METVLIVGVVAREQEFQHILTAQLGTVHGLVDVRARDVEQRVERQSQPVLDVVGEVREMSACAIVGVAIGASRGVNTTRHLVAAVWILIGRL